MFSAVAAFISGNYFSGLFLIAVMVCAGTIYIVLSGTAGYYPANKCIAVALLCAIITDGLWMFFVYDGEAFGGFSRPVINGMIQLACAFTVFFYGIIYNNITKRSMYKGYKIMLLSVSAVCILIITVNYLLYHFCGGMIISFSDAFPFLFDVAALILNAAAVILLGIFALISTEYSKAKYIASALLAVFAVTLTAVAVYYRIILTNELSFEASAALPAFAEYEGGRLF